MKKFLVLILAMGVALGVAGSLRAQEKPSMGPPKVIQIWREDVKPGKSAAHQKVEAGWPRAFANAKSPTHYLAMESISGPNEAWFVTGFDSLAAWEKDRQDNDKNPTLAAELARLSAQDGELLTGVRSVAATLRDDLSYNLGSVNLGQMRYFYLTTARVRPGHDSEFVESMKMVRAAHEKGKVPETWAVFEVSYGMAHGTYLIFQPLKSLAEVDAFPRTHEAYREAVGDDGRKKLAELDSASTLSRETNLFAFSPKMSYVGKETIDADPDFWAPKPKAAAKAAAAEGEVKPAAPAKKEAAKAPKKQQ